MAGTKDEHVRNRDCVSDRAKDRGLLDQKAIAIALGPCIRIEIGINRDKNKDRDTIC